ncbi:hypothetical protein [Haladaptatus sp. DJG-WS-42]|uniref:hypothetical protein n=1 Tax=Haladaptatus sp. DJG-WS-42 TaxID=3120516 RepID=UPI0030CC8B5F
MHRRLLDIGVFLLIVSILGYGIVILRQILFALVAGIGLYTTYETWKSGDTEHTLVLVVLISLLAGAFLTARLDYQVGALLITALAYLVWSVTRSREKFAS